MLRAGCSTRSRSCWQRPRTWATAKREVEDEITEREVTVLLADFATVWSELFPAEQARIVRLLVERVEVQEEAPAQ
jgi:site-specific DNA recombinase